MLIRSRRIRRIGAFALLLAWAPVATANAVTCAVWCEMNGGVAAHHASMQAEHHHGAGQTAPATKIAGPNCASPDLLVVTAVSVEAVALPAVLSTAVAVDVASPASFVSSFVAADTPPPRR